MNRNDDPEAVLDAVYRALDAVMTGSTCPRSVRCCRFAEFGRRPYVWPVEARRVLRALARRGGRLPRGGGDGDCLLLTADGACSIHADRPFGCRTFFCGDATLGADHRRERVEALSRQLRRAAETEPGAELLPLTTVLEAATDKDGRLRKDDGRGRGRERERRRR